MFIKLLLLKKERKMKKCPACEREFEGIEDFPLVEIVGFKRLPISKLISRGEIIPYIEKKVENFGSEALPEEVLKLFKESGKNIEVYEGKVYRKEAALYNNLQTYTCQEDLTDVVKKAIETREVKETLSSIEKLVGKEIRTRKLLKLLDFEPLTIDHNEITLDFIDEERVKKDGTRISRVTLAGSEYFIQDLAELYYIGKIN